MLIWPVGAVGFGSSAYAEASDPGVLHRSRGGTVAYAHIDQSTAALRDPARVLGAFACSRLADVPMSSACFTKAHLPWNGG